MVLLFHAIILVFALILAKPAIAVVDGLESTSQSYYLPDSFIVRYYVGQSYDALQEAVARQRKKPVSFIGWFEKILGALVLKTAEGETSEEKLQRLADIAVESGVTNLDDPEILYGQVYVYKTNGTKSIDEVVSLYQKQDEVEYAEPNYLYYMAATPNDTRFNEMWNLPKMKMPEAWDVNTGSKNVIVGVIDTGVDENHPDLVDNIVEVKKFVGCGDGDQVGHGTHTAGTVGAVGNNSKGIVGVNWQVGLLILKASCDGSFPLSAVSQSINYAVQRGAKVINMSLGGPSLSKTLTNAISMAVKSGTVVVAAAGNSPGPNADRLYPASDPNVITVSATGPSDELASYSSYGNAVDVAAPGGNAPGGSRNCTVPLCILSTWPGGYKAIEGTSMAAPHVAGLIGLMYAKDSTLTPSRAKTILESTADDLGLPGRDTKFGSGRINAKKALDAVLGTTPPSPTNSLTVPPSPSPTPFTSTAPTIIPPPLSPIPTIRIPTPTSIIPSPTIYSPSSTPLPNCTEGSIRGDYDCNGVVDKNDYISWSNDFTANKTKMSFFEKWRRVFFLATDKIRSIFNSLL